MGKVLGLDLGTNSIGISLRNQNYGSDLKDQLEYFGVTRFQEGVGKSKSGEFSYAAERTKKRSTRRLYQSRKYRIWSTLAVLIEYGYCPLSIEDLDKWRKYDKVKGLKRQYPTNAVKFEQWVRLDFNGDGVADYSSPFQLRAELMERQFDFNTETDRYKLGRALYHIAQRRGFRSSKGETIKEQESTGNSSETDEVDLLSAFKKSEEKKSKDLVSYMQENNLPTVGCAFYLLECNGIRVRNSIYQAVRSQYKDEITKIFQYQEGLDTNSEFYKKTVSEKKGEGSIFFKRPLRSQKGLVGKCTLEPNKPRCPISHPDFETYRAWSFINNIQYRENSDDEWQTLSLDMKQSLYEEKFLRLKISFKFEEIRKWIESKIQTELSKENNTINYKDNTNVSGCPISTRLKKILGDNWINEIIESDKERVNKKTGEVHKISYNYEDLWHIAFSFEEPECISSFAKSLGLSDDRVKQMLLMQGGIQQGYSMLSLKAIKNINRFLTKGLIYTDAVLLAKIPDLLGGKWLLIEEKVIADVKNIIESNRFNKKLFGVANNLIANYKSLDVKEQFANKDTQYILQDSDKKDVENALKNEFGSKTWAAKSEGEKILLIEKVSALYQQFFTSSNRKYFDIPKVTEDFAEYLLKTIQGFNEKDAKLLYHPSMIEYYAPSKYQTIEDGRSLKLLGSPVIGALKNPMAMRMLHTLRKQINGLLKTLDENGNPLIGEDTRVVVETAREMNDANMRWAVEKYQEIRASENKIFEDAISQYNKERKYTDDDIDNVRLMVEQHEIEQSSKENNKQEFRYEQAKQELIKKYRLWMEQGCRCIYTGKMISISSLFEDNKFDFEHTIPRSISFDNSLANLTVCDAHYNRSIKKNQIPTALPNYEKDVTIDGILYTAIKPRLQVWIDKVISLEKNVEFWKAQSKFATDKTRKDYCIRQRHLWQMELDYWQNKLSRFTMTEVKQGFRNSQLVDTRIISKYAFHYLKTVFGCVEVQKGSVTADFRKILGVQSVDEKKNRGKHSHHAIDATMLTLIPTAAQREKMIDLFYKKEEEKKLYGESDKYKYFDNQLQTEIKRCGIKGATEIAEFIENNILINHISKDQTLTPSHRRKRVRGKIVWKRDNNGNFIYDENGKKMPIWITGDSIRGKLHGETFYGAITQAQKGENKQILRNDDGSIKIGDEIYYVVRRGLKYKAKQEDPGFKDWDDLKKFIVNKDLIDIFKKQFPEGMSFKDACTEGIYMLDKYGNKINKVRHVRCYTSIRNPLALKKQTYLSTKEYKQNYYSEVGDLYVMCKYQSEDLLSSDFVIYSLFDISQNRKNGLDDIPKTIIDKKQKKLNLKYTLKAGDMILVYEKNTIDTLKEMDNDQLFQRLYVIRGFENDGVRIILQKHINAQTDKLLGKGESIKEFENLPQKIRCGVKTLNILKCGVHFKFTAKGDVDFI